MCSNLNKWQTSLTMIISIRIHKRTVYRVPNYISYIQMKLYNLEMLISQTIFTNCSMGGVSSRVLADNHELFTCQRGSLSDGNKLKYF